MRPALREKKLTTKSISSKKTPRSLYIFASEIHHFLEIRFAFFHRSCSKKGLPVRRRSATFSLLTPCHLLRQIDDSSQRMLPNKMKLFIAWEYLPPPEFHAKLIVNYAKIGVHKKIKHKIFVFFKIKISNLLFYENLRWKISKVGCQLRRKRL